MVRGQARGRHGARGGKRAQGARVREDSGGEAPAELAQAAGTRPVVQHRAPGRVAQTEMDVHAVARFGGSWNFIISFAVILIGYTLVNILMQGRAWDPYPFILLNLFLSMLASIQAPVIMMSQNRQDTKDRLRSELDFDVNRRAESEIQALSHKLNLITDKIGDVEDLLRENGNFSRNRSSLHPS